MTDILHQLYSTPLLQTHIAVPLKVLEYIKSQKFRRHDTGYMTHEKLLDDPLLKGIKKLITQKVEDYFYNYCGYAKIVTPVHVSSWANLHKKGDWGQQHYHENSVISFVWYPLVTESSGDNWGFTPKTGDLYIFPSNMVHGIAELEEDFDRYSLAGNYMINGPVKCGKVTVDMLK